MASIHPRIPGVTYRVQFHAGFTFADARVLVPYLQVLGITDLYASPILRARADSTHGYDVCDPNQVAPVLGGEEGFAELTAALKEHGIGFLLDTVPNHMGIWDQCNEWWMDVLENGPSSPYSHFFDIQWRPLKPELENRVLLPILDDQYGVALENGKLSLDWEGGSFYVAYNGFRLPVAPRTYSLILKECDDLLAAELSPDDESYAEYKSIVTALGYLPPRTETEPARLLERQREKEVIKRRLLVLCETSEPVAGAIGQVVRRFNGTPGVPESFDLLDNLLEAQIYRVAFWRVAGEEINYRRFFDVNDLAAVRVELPDVFAATHDLAFRLIREGKVTGLRVDHPDGLYRPPAYLRELQEQCLRDSGAGDEEIAAGMQKALAGEEPWPLYVVAEKILSEDEPLPADWAVYGTTGYDFLASVNGLFVDVRNERAFTRSYERFIRRPMALPDIVYAAKMRVMNDALASEMNALAYQLGRLAERNRRYRDFTLAVISDGLRSVMANLSVYRTYIDAERGPVSARDRFFVEQAIRSAKWRATRVPSSLFDFLRRTLLLESMDDFCPEDREDLIAFVMKFQQLSGPVMAKSVEDTAFYQYVRLASLNEVGGSPAQFGSTVPEFHQLNSRRRRSWPHSMLATSTHDTKRSEDVRARIDVLSEIPNEWRSALVRWSRANLAHKQDAGGQAAPDRNDEYLFYQTVLGAWPMSRDGIDGASGPVDGWPHFLQPPDNSEEYSEFRRRIRSYMEKATREAKLHTSWISPNVEYDDALRTFVEMALAPRRSNRFLPALAGMLRKVAFFGQFNSLSQTLLKLTAPGVPDIFQGNEMWDFSLVDPDNRRPVDFERRQVALARIQEQTQGGAVRSLVEELLESSWDGRVKLYLTARTLAFRRSHAELMTHGDYVPVEATGEAQDHLVSFLRRRDSEAVVVAPRLVHSLMRGVERGPVGSEVWGDTRLWLPPGSSSAPFTELFTGGQVQPRERDGRLGLLASEILAVFPVALLYR